MVRWNLHRQPKDDRRPCPTCKGNMMVKVKRTDKNGKTVKNEELCKTCDGDGTVKK